MANPNHVPDNPEMSLPVVDRETIEQVEASMTDASALYDELFARNEALALAVRRGAIDLAPGDPRQRVGIAVYALRLLKATGNQIIINRFAEQLATDGVVEVVEQVASQDGLPPAA